MAEESEIMPDATHAITYTDNDGEKTVYGDVESIEVSKSTGSFVVEFEDPANGYTYTKYADKVEKR